MTGRVKQKQRTQKALMAAANDLLARGEIPTIESVAAEANMSRATVYRYYRDIDFLVADAFFERHLPGADEVFGGNSDLMTLEDRVLVVEDLVNELMLSDEAALHLILRNFAERWLEAKSGPRMPRQGRRLPLIDAALAPYSAELGREPLRRLRNALALAIGTEAIIALREVCNLDAEETRAMTRWTCRALVRQAVVEAQAATQSS